MYQISSVPVPFNSSTDHATHLLHLPAYFGISTNKEYYVTLSAIQWSLCHSQYPTHCPMQIPITPIEVSSCISAIYLQHKTAVAKHCHFYFIPHAVKPLIHQIQPDQLLIPNTPDIRLRCPSYAKTIPGCNFCIIKISCLCTLRTPTAYLPKSLCYCHRQSRHLTVLHPLNLALVQAYFPVHKHATI